MQSFIAEFISICFSSWRDSNIEYFCSPYICPLHHLIYLSGNFDVLYRESEDPASDLQVPHCAPRPRESVCHVRAGSPRKGIEAARPEGPTLHPSKEPEVVLLEGRRATIDKIQNSELGTGSKQN